MNSELLGVPPQRRTVSTTVRPVLELYADLENRFPVSWHRDDVTYDAPINFNESMQSPRHRWFSYKEGFSPSFVRRFLSVSGVAEGVIYDPFCGVGTTILEAALLGRNGVGFDVNPLAHFVASSKCLNLNASELAAFESAITDFGQTKLRDVAPPPDNATVVSYFTPEVLDALLRVKKYYSLLRNEKIKTLFKLALLNCVEPFSTHRKAGNGVKRKRIWRHSPELFSMSALDLVRTEIRSQLRLYCQDIANHPVIGEAQFVNDSCLDSSLRNRRLGAVLTSPPYPNCFDYSKIYLSELWLGDFFTDEVSQKTFRSQSVRSHVHATWPNRFGESGSASLDTIVLPAVASAPLWSRRIPGMLQGYFQDLGELLKKLHPLLADQASVGIVIGNPLYGGVPIATDLLLAELAERHGFSVTGIQIYRRVVPASQQQDAYRQHGRFVRESLVMLQP